MKHMKIACAVALTAGLAPGQALAEDFPSKTIEVITHAGAGGGTDVNSRMMMLLARRVLKAASAAWEGMEHSEEEGAPPASLAELAREDEEAPEDAAAGEPVVAKTSGDGADAPNFAAAIAAFKADDFAVPKKPLLEDIEESASGEEPEQPTLEEEELPAAAGSETAMEEKGEKALACGKDKMVIFYCGGPT